MAASLASHLTMIGIVALFALPFTDAAHRSNAAGASRLQLIPEEEDTGAVLVVHNVDEADLHDHSWEESFECEVAGGHLEKVGREWKRKTKVDLGDGQSVSNEFFTGVILEVLYEVEGNLTCRDVLGLDLSSNTLLLRFKMNQAAVIRFTMRSPENLSKVIGSFWSRSINKMIARLTSVDDNGITAAARVTYTAEFIDDEILIANISHIIHRLSEQYDFRVDYVRSTQWCHRVEGGGFIWPKTPVGGRTVPLEPCVDIHGTPSPTRSCLGDFFSGAYWSALPSRPDPCVSASHRYKQLQDMAETASQTGSLERLTGEISSGPPLTPSEISLISVALRNLSRRVDTNSSNLSTPSVSVVAQIVDSILKSGKHAIQTADSVSGSSDSILDSVDRFLQAAASPTPAIVSTQHFTACSSEAEAGVSGFALVPDEKGSDTMVLLYRNTSKKDVLSMSPKMAAMLLEIPANMGVTSTVVEEDSIFGGHYSTKEVLGPVVGMTIFRKKRPKRTYNEVLITILLLFARDNDIIGDRGCHFWDRKDGRWSTDGCYITNDTDMFGCQCNHLTHFAMLLTRIEPSDSEKDKLRLITSVGCFTSLFCLFLIFLIAAICPQWCQGASRKVYLHVSASQAFLMLSYLTVSLLGHEAHQTLCVTLGSLLHYFLLASFAWMLVVAVLQTLRLTPKLAIDARRRSGTHLVLRASLFGWGLPALPVLINFCIDSHAYKRRPDTVLCYPEGNLFLATVFAPISFAILVNASVFLWIMCCLFCTLSPAVRVHSTGHKKQFVRRCFVTLFLFCLLGLSWFFGVAVELSAASESASIIFAYLFCATSTLQGASLFVFLFWDKIEDGIIIVLLKFNGKVSPTNSSGSRLKLPRTSPEIKPLNLKKNISKSADSKRVHGNRYIYLSKNNHYSSDEIRFKNQYQEVIDELIRKIDNL